MRVVFDTNVFIAAVLHPGLCEELFRRGISGLFDIALSPALLREVEQKLCEKSDFSDQQRENFLREIESASYLVKDTILIQIVDADPDDDMIIAYSLAADAELIISMDHHLLELKEISGIAIMHPSTFRWILDPS